MIVYWIVIDPMDNAIQLLNNWGQIVIAQASRGEGVGKKCLHATVFEFYKNIETENCENLRIF